MESSTSNETKKKGFNLPKSFVCFKLFKYLLVIVILKRHIFLRVKKIDFLKLYNLSILAKKRLLKIYMLVFLTIEYFFLFFYSCF